MNVLSALYGRVATARRSWFRRRPDAVRQLAQPVISVGNLTVGGSGKTPVVAHVTELLLARGERPAILSRGYARRQAEPGVTVVSAGEGPLVPVTSAGDEPFLLASRLPGACVLVCDDRYLAGQLAAHQFGATVFVLDDGFQHLRLARDVDLLLVDPLDLRERVLPSGRLREPLTAAAQADALIVPASIDEASQVASRLGVARAFTMQSVAGALVPVRRGDGGPEAVGAAPPSKGQPVVAVSGIARPERFLVSLEREGWRVADHVSFRDHHWFTRHDVERVDAAARAVSAAAVITTEKDAVRLSTVDAASLVPWFALPMRVDVAPAEEFAAWLHAKVARARAARPPVHG